MKTMVHHDNHFPKEKRNGSSFGADGLVRVHEYHPTTSIPTSSSLLPPRVPIPRLFSRSIDTLTQQQQQQQHQKQRSPLPQQVNYTPNNRPTVSSITTRSGDSNPSDCRSRIIVDSEKSATSSSSAAAGEESSSSSSSSSGPLIIHPSTLSYDDETQSRNPSHSLGTSERNEPPQPLTYPPSPPPQELYQSSSILNSPTMMRQPQLERDDEKKTMDSHHDDERASYRPRGSIRDVTHSWDMDVPNFPIQEIQRIKNKTNRIRTNRDSSSTTSSSHNNNSDSNTPLNSNTATKEAKNLPPTGQSARATSPRTPATSNPSSSSSKYQQHWTNLSNWNSNHNTSTASRGSRDSLSDVLGSVPSQSRRQGATSTAPFESTMEESHDSNGAGGLTSFLSTAARQAEHRLRQDFHKSRETTAVDDTKLAGQNVNTSTETDNSHTSRNDDSTEPNLILHDLCGEAVSTDDIAWRNALSVLAAHPELASIVDPTQIWTPLHICCLGMAPPPTYIVRALLYVYPKATYIPDDGGRLTLHLVAASSADIDIMQMIVQENPTALYHRDDHGLTPLHLYIRNRGVELTLQHVKVLLGYTLTDPNSQDSLSKRHVRQRRGDHLRMSVQSVDQWLLQQKCRPITNLHHNSMIHEQFFDTYPIDVQVSLRQLSQWKHSNNHAPMEEVESVEIQLSQTENKNDAPDDDDDDNHIFRTTKPAGIPLPNAAQYPIHMIVQRMIIEEAFVPKTLVDPSWALTKHDFEGHNRKAKHVEARNEKTSHPTSDSNEEEDEEEGNVSFEQSRSNQTSSILRLFAASFPEALNLRDKNGNTPLLQVMQIRDSFPSVDIVEILIGKRNASGFEALPSWADNLPTHTMIMQAGSTSMSSDQRRYINPAMIAVAETGQLPLHIAAEEAPTDSALIQTIYECYPAAVLVQDGRGRTPLHLSFHNYRRIAPDPKVIETLYTDRVATIVDDYGKIPFDLLVEHAELLSWHKPQTSRDIPSSTVYRKLFSASILGARHPTSPSQARTYLPRLRTLPPWLRVEACSTSFVQDMIVEELVSPWMCASILLDGVLLITLISVFRLQMKQFIDQLYDDNLIARWYTYTVYATAVGRFMARILFGYFTTTVGEFRSLCLFNIWYWIDVWAMLMSIVTSIFLYGNASDQRLLVLGTASTILLWLSFVGYLSSWWYSMAVFTGGFLQLFKFLTSPFLTAGVLVIAFAQCFYTLLQIDCANAMATTPVCTVRDSYRVVYMLMRGESLVDTTGINHFSGHATVLVASFLTLFAVFLLAVLVTILLTSSMLEFEDIALRSYWEPILGFILSTGIFVKENGANGQTRSIEVKKAHLWDMFMQTLLGGPPKMGGELFVYPLRSFVFTWIIALFIVPLWFLVGLVSLGLLWPPQIRRYFFGIPDTNLLCRNRSPRNEQAQLRLADVQNEIIQMKCMAYERSQKLESEIGEMKEILLMAMQD